MLVQESGLEWILAHVNEPILFPLAYVDIVNDIVFGLVKGDSVWEEVLGVDEVKVLVGIYVGLWTEILVGPGLEFGTIVEALHTNTGSDGSFSGIHNSILQR